MHQAGMLWRNAPGFRQTLVEVTETVNSAYLDHMLTMMEDCLCD